MQNADVYTFCDRKQAGTCAPSIIMSPSHTIAIGIDEAQAPSNHQTAGKRCHQEGKIEPELGWGKGLRKKNKRSYRKYENRMCWAGFAGGLDREVFSPHKTNVA